MSMTTINSIINQPTPLNANSSSATNNASSPISFSDVIDAINPLQHIPVISGAYRSATGGTISTGAKLAGDTIYGLALGGGALSVASSVTDAAVQQVTGKDITGNVVSGVSAIISSNQPPTPTITPLIPNNNPVQADQAPVATSFNLFPNDRNVAATGGAYHRAQAFDYINKLLVKIA